MDLPTRLRGAIRTRRIGRGLSQAAAAELAGLTQQYWARLESGDREPTVSMLGRVAEALGCRASQLVRAAEANPLPAKSA